MPTLSWVATGFPTAHSPTIWWWDSSIELRPSGFSEEFGERLGKFGLELHPEKTRLIEFGTFAQKNRASRGGEPESFTFLGFTHSCGINSAAKFTIVLKLRSQRGRLTSERMARLRDLWLAQPRLLHPYPSVRFDATHPT